MSQYWAGYHGTGLLLVGFDWDSHIGFLTYAALA